MFMDSEKKNKNNLSQRKGKKKKIVFMLLT